MRKDTKKSLKIAILAVFIGVFAIVSFNSAIASSITAKTIIKLVNESRATEGLKILQENPALSLAAADKAEDMLKNDYFAHNSPAGTTPWYWIEKNGYDYKYAGENLAMNFLSAEEEQKAWMKSPTHRKNILNANYQEIGVAVAEGKIDGKNTTVAVQMFGSSPNFVPAENLAENKTAVLGEEDNSLVLVDSQGGLKENDLVSELFPDEAALTGATPASGNPSWTSFKEKFGSENRPGWMVPLALNVLWVILIGNLLFLSYSLGRKVQLAVKKNEGDSNEQKIIVENLEDEGEIPVAVKIHILHTAK